jgi:hypothetical protein
MLSKRKVYLLGLVFAFVSACFFVFKITSANAACNGTFTCSRTYTECTPAGCNDDDDISSNDCTECHPVTLESDFNCSTVGEGECSTYIPLNPCSQPGWRITETCNYTPSGGGGTNPSPTPTTDPGGGGGGACVSDYCAGAAECAAAGGTAGAAGPRPSGGSCSSGTVMCCVPEGPPVEGCNCCGDPDWAQTYAGGVCDPGNTAEFEAGYYAGADSQCILCGMCVPSCSAPLCGQSDSCGSVCANTDNGAPNVPVITTPSANGVFLQMNAQGNVTVNWTSGGAKTEYYDIDIRPTRVAADSPQNISSTNTNSYTIPVTSRYYNIRVRSKNTSCGIDNSAWSAFRWFQVLAPVTGRVRHDPNNAAAISGGVCVGGNVQPPAEIGNTAVSGRVGTYTADATFGANYNYTMYMPYSTTGQVGATLTMDGENMTCTCPAGCNYASGINSPQTLVNFYVRFNTSNPWWQVANGPVAVYGTTGTVIQSMIPSLCTTPDCKPYLIVNESGTTTEGYAMTGGGLIDLSTNAGRQRGNINENGQNWFARLSSIPDRQDYSYFYKLAKLPANPTSDFGASAQNAALPSGAVVNTGAEAYYHNGNLTIGQNWNVGSTRKVAIIVNGNVTINNQILVQDGGFLMIVASGNITVSADLGRVPAGTAGIVEGVYVADGQFRLPSRGQAAGGDLKFIGEGTFVAWNGFVLSRDYNDGGAGATTNNTRPTEYFRYRPNLVEAAPDWIKQPRYNWREVNP